MNGAETCGVPSSPAASTSALPIRAPRRCISSRRSTGSRACAACWPVRGRGRPAPPTAIPHDRQAGRDPAASRPGPRQRPCQSAQRQQGATPDGQHRRRPCDLSSAYDAPLTSDIEGLGAAVRTGCKTSPDAKSVAADGAAAIAAARQPPAQIATLILPADTAWNEGWAGRCRRRAARRDRRPRKDAGRAALAASRR